jgi:homotetrameric cytidine deaminase
MPDTFTTHSYVPFSQNPRTCVVEGSSGRFYAGVRIENISYPLTIPAVQAACTICLSEGDTPSKLYLNESNYEQLHFWKNEFELEVIFETDLPTDNLEYLLQPDTDQITASSKLQELLSKAVVPNSDFQVAALLFTDNGYYEGVNIEVSEWTKGLCAERVAIAKAITAGHTEFKRFEILTKKGQVSSPCGSCRQVITEFMPTSKIVLHHADKTISEHFMNDLLPFNFTSDSLKK